MGPEGISCRVVVATHPAGPKKSPIGVTRAGVVFELFLTRLPQQAFTAADVVELYLHRGTFETTLSDEDQEQDPDRWVSHAAAGQEVWQLISQWVWNLRLELGHQLQPELVRTTEFAPAASPRSASIAPSSGYAPPQVGSPWKVGRFWGQDFALQPDGTLRCPAEQTLVAQERRREADGSLRVAYAASIRSCAVPVRGTNTVNGERQSHCQTTPGECVTASSRGGSAPLLWRDWSRRRHRRACLQLRSQRIEIQLVPALPVRSESSPLPLSRAQRAHDRLTFQERLARNARTPSSCCVTIKLFGIPESFATSLGLATA